MLFREKDIVMLLPEYGRFVCIITKVEDDPPHYSGISLYSGRTMQLHDEALVKQRVGVVDEDILKELPVI